MKYKTVWTKKEEIERKWYIVDVKDQILGRVATKIASLLIGKEKPEIVPDVDCGDYVIVINSDNVKLTRGKESKKHISDTQDILEELRKLLLRDRWKKILLK